MEKKSILTEKTFLDRLEKAYKEGPLQEKYYHIFLSLFDCYKMSLINNHKDIKDYLYLFDTFLTLVLKNYSSPHQFALYHKKIRKDFDYYRFGIDFFRPLVDVEKSSIMGEKNLSAITHYLKAKENVVLLANHQIESDPQAISILLEKHHSDLAEKIIYVAGERVISDILAIPLSLGCDMLCIYSKKYISIDPEKKHQKQLHNTKTMQYMRQLLSEGGKIIYVAPSGGRDRPDNSGHVCVAPFDAQSIEMFYLMSKHAKKPTHFFPLALDTYDLLPPPDDIQKELGEKRLAKYTPIHLSFGQEIDMEKFPGHEETNKAKKRKKRADYIFHLVHTMYQQMQ